MKHYLNDRVKFVGIPDSGDSTYARAGIEGHISNQSPFNHTTVIPQVSMENNFNDPNHLFTQFVSVSRTTDEKGTVISTVPQIMDIEIFPYWYEGSQEWLARVLKTVSALQTESVQ